MSFMWPYCFPFSSTDSEEADLGNRSKSGVAFSPKLGFNLFIFH